MSYNITAPGVWGMRRAIESSIADGEECHDSYIVASFVIGHNFKPDVPRKRIFVAAIRAQRSANV